MGLSKSGSMKGYKLKVWLKKNKETIKNLISAAVGIGVFFIPTIKDVGTSAAAGTVASVLTKLIVDTVDFLISDVEIPETPALVIPPPSS